MRSRPFAPAGPAVPAAARVVEPALVGGHPVRRQQRDATEAGAMQAIGVRRAERVLEVEDAQVLVHAKADDLKTQPTGDAGGRQGCGVIGAAKP